MTVPKEKPVKLVVEGPNGGYLYPFQAQDTSPYGYSRGEDFTSAPFFTHLVETAGLTEKQGKFYCTPGFDLQRTIATLNAPAVEVGGPTKDGYEVLRGIEFTQKPIITNRLGTKNNMLLETDQYGTRWIEGKAVDSIQPADYAERDTLVDTRSFAFVDNSLGVVLSKSLFSVAHDMDQNLSSKASMQMRELAEKGFHTLDASLPLAKLEQSTEAQLNPRIGLLIGAKRALKTSGLVVIGETDLHEIEFAIRMGFHLRMVSADVSPMLEVVGKELVTVEGVYRIKEVVFQK